MALSWSALKSCSGLLEYVWHFAGRYQKRTFEQLRSDLSMTKLVNNKLKEKVAKLERQTWTNSQYSRRDCLDLSDIPETIENEYLEGKVLGIFEKLHVMMDSSNVEDCRWIKSSKSPIKVIVKDSRQSKL